MRGAPGRSSGDIAMLVVALAMLGDTGCGTVRIGPAGAPRWARAFPPNWPIFPISDPPLLDNFEFFRNLEVGSGRRAPGRGAKF